MHPVTMYTIDALSFLFISDISLRYKEAGGGEGNVGISKPDTSTHSGKIYTCWSVTEPLQVGPSTIKNWGVPQAVY